MKNKSEKKSKFQSEAGKLLNDLLDECKGTPDEGRILIANAQLAEARGDIETALSVLRDINIDHGEHFIRSREIMATIYLQYRKDRRLYAGCYRFVNGIRRNIARKLSW